MQLLCLILKYGNPLPVILEENNGVSLKSIIIASKMAALPKSPLKHTTLRHKNKDERTKRTHSPPFIRPFCFNGSNSGHCVGALTVFTPLLSTSPGQSHLRLRVGTTKSPLEALFVKGQHSQILCASNTQVIYELYIFSDPLKDEVSKKMSCPCYSEGINISGIQSNIQVNRGLHFWKSVTFFTIQQMKRDECIDSEVVYLEQWVAEAIPRSVLLVMVIDSGRNAPCGLTSPQVGERRYAPLRHPHTRPY